MKYFSLVLFLILFTYSSFSQEIWETVDTGINQDLNDLYFINDSTGFAVGDSGIIIATENSGVDWNLVEGNTQFNLNSIYFINENLGWIAGDHRTLLKTTDAGTSWNPLDFSNRFDAEEIIDGFIDDTYSIRLYDFDFDDDDDLLSFSKYGNRVTWYKNLGNGIFSDQIIITESIQIPNTAAAIDVEGDGDLDIYVASFSPAKIYLIENLGDMNFAEPVLIPSFLSGIEPIFPSDVDGDGLSDIIVGSDYPSRLSWFKYLGNSQFSDEIVISNSINTPRTIFATDFDLDGDQDLICGAYFSDKIFYYENMGSGIFDTATTITSTSYGVWHVFVADFNNDGLPDITSAAQGDNDISWYKNLGNGVFTDEIIIDGSFIGPRYITAVDLDNDNDNDIISTSYTTDYIVWYENLGSDLFSSRKIISSTTVLPLVVQFSDRDDDGDLDLIAKSSDPLKIAWFNNNSGNVDYSFKSLFFIDEQSGWMGSDLGVIFKTTNGGIEWIPQVTGVNSRINDIYMIDVYKGWALTNDGILLVTEDGGDTWVQETIDSGNSLNNLSFYDQFTGWMSCDNGKIFYTTDRGRNWSLQQSSTINNLNSISFVDQASGWAAGDSGIILHTTDSGNFWSVTQSPIYQSLNSIFSLSNNLIWICADNGKILRLIPPIKILAPNGGEQWQSNTTQSIEWSSYEISDVKIEFTSNGGTSWNTIISSTPSTGNYLWSLPPFNSTVCKIRISNVTDSSVFDESDNYFTIQAEGLFIVWTKTFGNIWDDEGLSITETKDHNFALSGYTKFYDVDHFQKDILLLKLDEYGDSLWMKTFDFNNHDDIGYSIIETSDGGLFVGGSAWDLPGHEACYVLKTDGEGNFQWDDITGLDGDNESFYAVTENELQNYVAVGDISPGTPPIFLIKTYLNSGADGDSWSSTDYDYGYSIVRRHGLDGYAVAGVKDAGWVLLLTKNSLRPEMFNRYSMGAAAYSIAATFDSSYIVTGYSTSQPSDILLIKYDINGTMKWLKSFGGDSADIGYSVLETNDHGFIIAGSTESFGSGGKDVYIVRTDSLGEEIWTMTIGGTDDDEARSIKKTFDGGYIISGSTSSFGSGAKDVWVIKLSQDAVIPVSLMTLSAFVEKNFISLNWQTATETNNSGFELQRSEMSIVKSQTDWQVIGFVPGFGTTAEPKSYSFTDEKLPDGKYQYRLKQIDFDGSFEYSNTVEIEITSPLEFTLEQNYPNPFNPSTKIKYTIPTSPQSPPSQGGEAKQGWFTVLKVFDVLGNEVATLVNEIKPAGTYEAEFNASAFSSGVYFYQLRAGDFVQTKKMALIK